MRKKFISGRLERAHLYSYMKFLR